MTPITDDMKTDWYPRGTKPVREGFYEREYCEDEFTEVPDFWDGEFWHAQHRNGTFDPVCATNQTKRWRGLKAPHDGQTS